MMTKGIVFDIKKFAIHDGAGIRTTVFFKGCPLGCWWCHNPEGRNPEPEAGTGGFSGSVSSSYCSGGARIIGREMETAELMEEIRKDTIFYDQSGGGVTVSGGEPMMQPGFLLELLESCRREGISTAVDTCGCAQPEAFETIYDKVDLFLYDIKLMDDREHVTYTGVSNRLILENLTKLSEMGSKVLPRIALIPGITDTRENIDGIIRFLGHMKNIRKVSLLPYNKIGEDKYARLGIDSRLGNLSTQTDEEIHQVERRFASSGYDVDTGG
jgi:pyruvate formate lyase activating enzyme